MLDQALPPRRRRLKALISAYAFAPGLGSEPGLGWRIATEIARDHDVWVITRKGYAPLIRRELDARPLPSLRVAYLQLPFEPNWLYRTPLIEAHYRLWQRALGAFALRLHAEIGFDVAHHATYARYYTPSGLADLPIPLIFGPVGGAETTPDALRPGLAPHARLKEGLREAARALSLRDPALARSWSRTAIAIAATEETRAAVMRLGARDARLGSNVGVGEDELDRLAALAAPDRDAPLHCLSIGRLLHWKGVDLSIEAFARASLPGARFTIIGDGPERGRLQALASACGVADRVEFLGALARTEVFAALGRAHLLLHPSLHDSGPFVTAEAGAAGRPVICLDTGGPAIRVNGVLGTKIAITRRDEVVREISDTLRRYDRDRGWIDWVAEIRDETRRRFAWPAVVAPILDAYDHAISTHASPAA